jgi:hypothetical protein
MTTDRESRHRSRFRNAQRCRDSSGEMLGMSSQPSTAKATATQTAKEDS